MLKLRRVKFSENSTKSITPRCEIDVLRLSGIKEEKKIVDTNYIYVHRRVRRMKM